MLQWFFWIGEMGYNNNSRNFSSQRVWLVERIVLNHTNKAVSILRIFLFYILWTTALFLSWAHSKILVINAINISDAYISIYLNQNLISQKWIIMKLCGHASWSLTFLLIARHENMHTLFIFCFEENIVHRRPKFFRFVTKRKISKYGISLRIDHEKGST